MSDWFFIHSFNSTQDIRTYRDKTAPQFWRSQPLSEVSRHGGNTICCINIRVQRGWFPQTRESTSKVHQWIRREERWSGGNLEGGGGLGVRERLRMSWNFQRKKKQSNKVNKSKRYRSEHPESFGALDSIFPRGLKEGRIEGWGYEESERDRALNGFPPSKGAL